jgi:hypothetical protein
MRAAIVFLLALCLVGCATYKEDLNRGQRMYDEHEYERALAVFRYLEADLDSLSYNDQARYAYLRGMTDYRLGEEFRADSRHWLAMAKAIEQEHPGGLTPKWKQMLEEALNELNREVYARPYLAAKPPPIRPPPPPAQPGTQPAAPPAPQPAAPPAQPPAQPAPAGVDAY